MSELGLTLRKAREEQGLTLDEIQETTKIRKHYLEAIEEGNYKALPGSFYVRAFVKNYADAVGLDSEELLRVYKSELPGAAPDLVMDTGSVRLPRRSATPRTSERFGKLGFSVLMWSFLLLIFVLVYVFVVNRDTGETQRTVDDTPITDKTTPPAANGSGSQGGAAGAGQGSGSQSNGSTGGTGTGSGSGQGTGTTDPGNAPGAGSDPQTATTVTFSKKSGKTDHYEVAPAGRHTVDIAISGGQAWLEVRKDGSKGEFVQNGIAEDGTKLSFELDTPLYINTGRADLTEIKIDGQVVNDGDRPGSKKIQFNPASGTAAAEGTMPGEAAADNQAAESDTSSTDQ